MAETTTATSKPLDLAFDVARHISDTFDIGDRRAAELHDQTRHNALIKSLQTQPLGRLYMKARPAPVNLHFPVKDQHVRKSLRQHRSRGTRPLCKARRQWWDLKGPQAALHKLNPTRIGYLRNLFCAHFPDGDKPRVKNSEMPLTGLRIVDLGCGGGLLAEPLAQLGARVTAIDPAEENILAPAATRNWAGSTSTIAR